MKNYYTEKLSAERLKRCYEIAPPRVKQYLEAEVEYVLQKIKLGDQVLELGCGYGRVMKTIARKAETVFGIDKSFSSLELGNQMLSTFQNCNMIQMDVVKLAFHDRTFDVVIGIQNGISAFHVDQNELIKESIRVTKNGGTVLFSSYSNKFWNDRLNWFEIQSSEGLLGEIDYEKSIDGVIVCKDGFKSGTVTEQDFKELTSEFNVDTKIIEIDESSVFCEIEN